MTDFVHQFPVSALLVGEYSAERSLVHDVFQQCGWRLFEAGDRRHALESLARNPVRVVITESDLPWWNWRRVLHDLRLLAVPPQLVVTSRTADEYLWAEVLNVGGYDVLAQPLDREEVQRVVAAAARHYDQHSGQRKGSAAPAAYHG